MSEPDRPERLESWKEIAVYLRRGVSTVQRWEQQEGLPVHRLPHAKKGSIFAIKCELDAWWRARAQLGPLHDDVGPSKPRRLVRLGGRTGVVLAALFALAVTGLAMWRMLDRVERRACEQLPHTRTACRRHYDPYCRRGGRWRAVACGSGGVHCLRWCAMRDLYTRHDPGCGESRRAKPQTQ